MTRSKNGSKAAPAVPQRRATGPARKPGARKRANIVLQKPSRLSAIEDPRAFWSCHNTLAPQLKTSFGNYSTLNLVKRQVITTSTTQDTLLLVPNLSQSCIAAFRFTDTGAATPLIQHVYGPLTSGFPQSIRPLRMSLELKNLTTAVNVAGTVMCLSYDNALDVDAVYNVNALAGANLSAASVSSLKLLVEGAPETSTYTGAELLSGHSFVSCPSAWPEYNHYYDFIAPAFTGDNTQMASLDLFNISEGQEGGVYPGAVTALVNRGFGDVPGMRGFLLVFKATPNAQTYEITFRRQDGARYPANSLGHMFHRPARAGDDKSEQKLLDYSRVISANPSVGVPTDSLSVKGSVGAGLRSGLHSALQTLAQHATTQVVPFMAPKLMAFAGSPFRRF